MAFVIFAANALLAGASRFRRSKGDCYSMYDGKPMLTYRACSENMLKDMKNSMVLCKDLSAEREAPWGGECVAGSAICPAEAAAQMMARFGEHVAVETLDAGAHFRDMDAKPASVGIMANSFFNTWRELDEQNAEVDRQVSMSGGAAVVEVVGETVEGRPIRAVKLTGQGYKAGGPKVVVTFNLHAREWVTGMAGVYAVTEITQKAKSDPSWLAGTEVVLVPMANPDGYQYSRESDAMWRKNRSPKQGSGWRACPGTDLNRNFPVGWGENYATSTWSCSDVYVGKASASEPETKAVMKVIDESKLSVLLDVHAYGKMILKPWSYTWDAHPRLKEVDELGKALLAATASVRNSGFRYGGNELLGPASGVLPDYMNGGLGYTYELSTSFHPPTSEIVPSGEETLRGIYAAIEWAQKQ